MSAISGAYYFKTFGVVHFMKEKCKSIDTISRIARFKSRASHNWVNIVNLEVCEWPFSVLASTSSSVTHG